MGVEYIEWRNGMKKQNKYICTNDNILSLKQKKDVGGEEREKTKNSVLIGIILTVVFCLCIQNHAAWAKSETSTGNRGVQESQAEDFSWKILADGTVEIIGYEGTDTNVVIPCEIDGKKVTSIGDFAFEDCKDLNGITLPDSIISIGGCAFVGCSSLREIAIPDSVTSIDVNAFSSCSSLSNIKVDSANVVYDSRNNCNAVIHKQSNTLLFGCKNTVIPNSVVKIGDNAFCCCENLAEIHIPDSVTEIGVNAFAGCTNLKKIHIPDRLTKIGMDAFVGCTNLTEIRIPSGVTSIEAETFIGCVNLVKVIIPASVTKIADSAFWVNMKDKDYIMKNIVLYVSSGSYAESYAKKNKIPYQLIDNENSGSLPVKGEKLTDSKTKAVYTVTKPGSAVAYAGTTNKKAVSLSVPSTIKIGGKTYKVTSVAKNALKNNKKLQKITISGNVSDIGAGAFQGCTALKTVKMGSKVTSIGDKAFYGCKKLSSLTIGKKVSAIGKSAFQNCTALKKVTIPDKVKKIGGKAFSGCKKLTGITVKSKKLTEKNVGSKAFEKAGSSNYKKVKVTVPAKKYAAYKKLLKKKGLSKKAKIVKK